MNLKEYTGNIDERQDRGKGQGRRLKWAGNQYKYVSDCNKWFKSLSVLEEHEHYCEECEKSINLEIERQTT